MKVYVCIYEEYLPEKGGIIIPITKCEVFKEELDALVFMHEQRRFIIDQPIETQLKDKT